MPCCRESLRRSNPGGAPCGAGELPRALIGWRASRRGSWQFGPDGAVPGGEVVLVEPGQVWHVDDERPLEQLSRSVEDAAQSLGAPPRRILWRVTLPLVLPHLLAGGLFAFALSMLEVSDSLILAQQQAHFPVTKAIFELSQLIGEGRLLAAALGVWAMLLLATTVWVARRLVGDRGGGYSSEV